MLLRSTLLPVLCLPSLAWAACPEGAETLLSCTFREGARSVTTCLDGTRVRYAYGPTGAAPELALTRDIRLVDVRPWNGFGRYINESFTLENAGFRYTLRYAIDKFAETDGLEAELWVHEGETELALMTCDPGSVVFAGYPWPLFDVKQAAGQTWDRDTETWREGVD